MADLIDVFNEDDTRRGRILIEVAHRMPWAITVCAVLEIPYYLYLTHPLLSLLSLAAVVPVLIGLFHTVLTRLCIRCMVEMPQDGSQRADRHRWLLRLYHRQQGLRAWLILLAVIILAPILVPVLGLPRWVELPVDVYWYAWLSSLWVHHRLRLWCPGCHDGDDGGWIEEPSPDPVTAGTR